MEPRLGIKACTVSVAVLITLFSHLTFAKTPSLDEQRALYREGKIAIAKNDRGNVQRILGAIGDYPLKPYLEYLWLSDRLRGANYGDVDDFLTRNGDSSLANRMRYRWLETLRARDRWQDYLKYYDPRTATTEQQCYYQLARMRHGERDAASAAAIKLWTVGKSQPKGCDRLFDQLIANHQITEDIAWQRYTAAVLNHQYQLARYLQRFFTSAKYQRLAASFYQVDSDHAKVGDYQLFIHQGKSLDDAEIHSIIIHGLTHLAREDATTALKHWNRYQQIHPFTAEQKTQVIGELAKGLYQQAHPEVADQYLIENVELIDPSLLEWRAREAIRQTDWQQLLAWIGYMPASLSEQDRWLYWRARGSELSRAKGAKPSIKSAYQVLSRTRSFYGFMASEWLGTDYAMAFRQASVTQAQIDELQRLPGLRRTRELIYQEDYLSARREWYYTNRHFNEQQWIGAALIASQWQWHNGAITSLINAGFWDDINLRFPIAFKQAFDKQARETGVPVHLLFAVARQESALAQDVVSPAGARGLMQLMPATAEQTARKNHIHYRGSNDLFEPEINITLGSRYYREMLARFGNNRILATAAYNAGPSRVDRWLQDSEGKLPFDAWIETIPFRETRGYVQNVLAFSMIYAHHLESKERILTKQEKQRSL
ncbi:transglycosylase SLT domain-containing protein [Porticoccus sp.]